MKLGEIIKNYRKEHNLTLREFAKICGTSHSYIAMLEDGKNSKTGEPMIPTLTTLKKISKALNISLNELISTAEDMPVTLDSPQPKLYIKPMSFVSDYILDTMFPNFSETNVPVLGDVAAGIPIETITDILDYEEISPDMIKDGSEYFALRIKGDSMEPKISEGDVVIVRKQPDVDSGQIAIVCVNGDNATCKKVMKQESGILLVANNPLYAPVFYPNEDIINIPITILGRVVELRAKF